MFTEYLIPFRVCKYISSEEIFPRLKVFPSSSIEATSIMQLSFERKKRIQHRFYQNCQAQSKFICMWKPQNTNWTQTQLRACSESQTFTASINRLTAICTRAEIHPSGNPPALVRYRQIEQIPTGDYCFHWLVKPSIDRIRNVSIWWPHFHRRGSYATHDDYQSVVQLVCTTELTWSSSAAAVTLEQ